jgi:hypothetical protein
MQRKPNLFIIGAMKSGTTSLHNILSTHPKIFMAPVKEPDYFLKSKCFDQEKQQYLKLFAGASDELYVGESSTAYSKLPYFNGVAKRINNYSPKAKIIYLVRDPFERILSQYKHMVRYHFESRPLSQVVSMPYDDHLTNSYLTNSYYAYQLKPYIDLFGFDSIYVATFESFINCPEVFVENLLSWLGIDNSFIPPNLGKIYHPSLDKLYTFDKNRLIGSLGLRIIRERITKKPLAGFLNKWVKTLFSTKLVDFMSVEFQDDFEIVRSTVASMLSEWIKALEEIAHQSFAIWPSSKKYNDNNTPNQDLTLKLESEINKALL